MRDITTEELRRGLVLSPRTTTGTMRVIAARRIAARLEMSIITTTPTTIQTSTFHREVVRIGWRVVESTHAAALAEPAH